MTAGGALQSRHQAHSRDVLDFAEEGERDVPDLVAGPPQVRPAGRSGAAAASSSSRAAAGGTTATNSLMPSFLAGAAAPRPAAQSPVALSVRSREQIGMPVVAGEFLNIWTRIQRSEHCLCFPRRSPRAIAPPPPPSARLRTRPANALLSRVGGLRTLIYPRPRLDLVSAARTGGARSGPGSPRATAGGGGCVG